MFCHGEWGWCFNSAALLSYREKAKRCIANIDFFILPFRVLESQLQTQKKSYENELEALKGEIQGLREENNRQQQLLAQNLQLPPEARIEASLQHEITRLTNENLVCRSFIGDVLKSIA